MSTVAVSLVSAIGGFVVGAILALLAVRRHMAVMAEALNCSSGILDLLPTLLESARRRGAGDVDAEIEARERAAMDNLSAIVGRTSRNRAVWKRITSGARR